MGLDTWVKARRVALGWKQETLGKALGRDQSWVSRIENGLAGSLDVNDVIALGDVLGDPDGAIAAAREEKPLARRNDWLRRIESDSQLTRIVEAYEGLPPLLSDYPAVQGYDDQDRANVQHSIARKAERILLP